MVFAGLYPVESHEHGRLRDALEKLRLNDSAFNFEPENSVALGFGFRCGFLGLLHLEIIQERLEREFQIDLITTAPGVRYKVTTLAGDVIEVDNPTKFPNPAEIKQIEEPIIDATVITREEYVGEILKLLEEKRGTQKKFEYIGTGRVLLLYELPLNEIVLDFYDRLKSASRGYASLDYHFSGYRVSPMVKLDVLVAGEPVDALSMIVHKDFAYERGKMLIERLRKLIPAADVRSGAAGRDREQGDRARDHPGHAQERAGEVLWRRYLAQTQAARKAKGRQEAHEARGPGGDPAGGVPGGVEGWAIPNSDVPRSRHFRSPDLSTLQVGAARCPTNICSLPPKAHLGVITLNRPERRNALSLDLMLELISLPGCNRPRTRTSAPSSWPRPARSSARGTT